MFKMNRNLLSVALASAILALAQSAQAQADQVIGDQAGAQTDEDEDERRASDTPEVLEAIQATGIRASIESAIAVKQDSTSVVEVVTAEDIGKLPDVSIAESIARLPGLTAQRVAGRAQTISIRGLAGDFATTLLNGREQVSTGDNRGVEFDQYPSELLNAVVVYKTQDGSLIGQGLSGTVDLRTVRPLSFDEPVLAVNLRGEKNSLGELNADSSDHGYRFSTSYIDQFADGTLGLALGYARLDSPGQARRWGAWGYPTANIGGVDGVSLIGGSESWATSTDNVRDGFMGVLEYRPNDDYASVLDVYYSQFEKAETTRALQVGLGWSGATLTNPVVENGRLVDATWVGVRPVIRNDQNDREDDIFAIGWNNEWKLSEDWSAALDLSYSKADREESILETYAGSLSTDTVRVDSRGTPPILSFGLDYTDPNSIVLTDPGGWGQNGYIKYPEVEDKLTSFRASAERAFSDGHFSSVEFGINYADRQKSRFVAEAFLDLIASPTSLTPGLLTDPADLSFSGIPGVIAYDVNAAFAQFYRPRTNVNPDILNKAWEVNEEVLTGYFQANIDTVWGDVPVRGNIGVQVIQTDQDSSGFAVPNGNAAQATPYSGSTSYTDILPSLNLSFSLENENVIRLGIGRQLARARLDQIRANNNYNLDPATLLWSGGGGNPELEPWRANAVDVSWEKYFGNRGYFGLAFFYKDLRNYIYEVPVTFDFSEFDDLGLNPPTDIGNFTRPENGEGGSLKGIEASLSVPFDLFSDALEGFGFVGNYTYTDTNIEPGGPGSSQPLPGFSKNTSNVSFYYEKYGFQTRISRRWRSDFLGEIQGFGADRAFVQVQEEAVLDAQIGYTFESGEYEGLSILLQGYNLTNEPYREYFDVREQPRNFNEYGRTYLLGVSYKF